MSKPTPRNDGDREDITEELLKQYGSKKPDNNERVDISSEILAEYYRRNDKTQPGYHPGKAAVALGGALIESPLHIAASAVRAYKGHSGATVVNPDIGDQFVNWVKERGERQIADAEAEVGKTKAAPGLELLEFAKLPQNIGLSVMSAITGLVAGVATAKTVAGAPAAWAVGMSASGAAAYRMSGHMFTSEYLAAKNEEHIRLHGRPLSTDQENNLKKEFEHLAREHSLWEAVPETIGNVAQLKVLITPLTRMFGKHLATRLVGKVTGLYAPELATETVTQIGQSKTAVKAGMAPEGSQKSFTKLGEGGWGEAAAEVAPATFLLVSLFGGVGGAVVVHSNNKKSRAVVDGVASGAHKELSDKELADVIKGATELSNDRLRDRKLTEAVGMLKAEADRRMGETAETEARVQEKIEAEGPAQQPDDVGDFADDVQPADGTGGAFPAPAATTPELSQSTDPRTSALETFKSFALGGGMTLTEAFERRNELIRIMPEIEDDLNKIIIEAEGNRAFALLPATSPVTTTPDVQPAAEAIPSDEVTTPEQGRIIVIARGRRDSGVNFREDVTTGWTRSAEKKGGLWLLQSGDGKAIYSNDPLAEQVPIKGAEAIPSDAELYNLNTGEDIDRLFQYKTKQYGSKKKYLASEEYAQAYPVIDAIYQWETEQMIEAARMALQDAGLEHGHRVILEQNGEKIRGRLIFTGNKEPYVAVQMAKILGLPKTMPWHTGWKLDGPPDRNKALRDSGLTETEIDYVLDEVATQMREGEGGGIKGMDDATGEFVYGASTYPDWFRDMVKRYKKKGKSISSEQVAAVIGRVRGKHVFEGEQSGLYYDIVDAIKREVRPGGAYYDALAYYREMEKGERNEIRNAIEAEGIDPGAVSEIEESLVEDFQEAIAEEGLTPEQEAAALDELADFFDNVSKAVEPAIADPPSAETATEPSAKAAPAKEETGTLEGMSETDTFTLNNPETEWSAKLPEQTTPKNAGLFDAEPTAGESKPIKDKSAIAAPSAQRLPSGWEESQPGRIATNPDPVTGGIIDRADVSGKWFVIPNNDAIPKLVGFATRQEAFDAMEAAVKKLQAPAAKVGDALTGDEFDAIAAMAMADVEGDKPAAKPMTNRELTIRDLGDVGTKVQFTTGLNKEVMTISEIDKDGKVRVGKSGPFRYPSDFKKAASADLPTKDAADTFAAAAQAKAEQPEGIDWGQVNTAVDLYFKNKDNVADSRAIDRLKNIVAIMNKATKAQYESEVAAGPKSDGKTNVPIQGADGMHHYAEEATVKPIKPSFFKETGVDMKGGKLVPHEYKPSLTNAAAEAGKGVEATYDALAALFKAKSKDERGSMSGLDSDLYAAVKPLLSDAYTHFKAAGREVKDWIVEVITQLKNRGVSPADSMPYVKHFYLNDMQALTKGAEGDKIKTTGGIDNAQNDTRTNPLQQPNVDGSLGLDDGQSPRVDAGDVSGQSPKGVSGSQSSVGDGEVDSITGAGTKRRPGRGSRPNVDNIPERRPGTDERGSGGTDAGTTETDTGMGGTGLPGQPGTNNRISPDDVLFHSGKVARINANIKAISTLKKIEADGRPATAEEKKILQQFSGWGAVTEEVFKDKFVAYLEAHEKDPRAYRSSSPQNYFYTPSDTDKYTEWETKYGKKLHPLLGGMLTKEEWRMAADSGLNAHYTAPEVIKAMWNIAERLGVDQGRVLEPAAGVGHFLGLMPENLVGKVQLAGVELDPITGRILTALYPESKIQVAGFEKASIQDNFYDMVMSNFPFGDYPVHDAAHDAYNNWHIHNYFFARSLDAVRPGGIVMAVTSRFTMDSTKYGKVRDYLAGKADFIGAIRLPGTAFSKNAGTEVTTDIIILQKKTGTSFPSAINWRTVLPIQTKEGDSFNVNEYFVSHPEMVLGEHSSTGSMYGPGKEYTVTPASTLAIQEHLDMAIDTLPRYITKGLDASESSVEKEAAAQHEKDGAFVVHNGKLGRVKGTFVEPVSFADNAAKVKRAKEYIGIRDVYKELIDAMNNEKTTDAEIAGIQAKMNSLYDKFVSKNGHFHDRSNKYLNEDDEYVLALSLEDVKNRPGKKGGIDIVETYYEKGDVFTKRTVHPFREPSSAENIDDAANLSITYRNAIDIPFIAGLLKVEPGDAKTLLLEKTLAYENPSSGLLEHPSEYLSGNVRRKLHEAEAAGARYKDNVEALKNVQPPDKVIDEIPTRLGDEWVPADIIEGFSRSLIPDNDVDVTMSSVAAGGESAMVHWHVKPTGYIDANSPAYMTWGAERHNFYELLEDSLNLKRTSVYDWIPDDYGSGGKDVFNLEKSLVARQKQKEIQAAFRSYILSNNEVGVALAQRFNTEKNNYVIRQYEAPKIDRYPGASNLINLREHQKKGVSRGVTNSTIFAHAVGTGKTYLYTTLGMELRRIKAARKPAIVVQGSTIKQFATSARKLYPTAKILALTKDLTSGTENRRSSLAKIASGDWDIVILPHSTFNLIGSNPEREAGFIQEQLDEIREAIASEGGIAPESSKTKRGDSMTVKQLRKMLKRKEARLATLRDKPHEDKAIYFEDLGIDALLIDEAHTYKRGDFFTKMDNIKGLDRSASQKSFDFLMKVRYVQEKTGGKNIYLATGTPITNTLAEIWTIMRYTRPELLREYGVEHFDGFASLFTEAVADLEPTETGEYRQVERLKKYRNGFEMMNMWLTAADVILQEDVPGWKDMVPALKDGGHTNITLERSEELGRLIDSIRERRREWNDLSGKEKREQSHVPLVLYGEAKKAAIDLRLVHPENPDTKDSKVNNCVEEAYTRYKESTAIKGTQLIFCDIYQSPDPAAMKIKKNELGQVVLRELANPHLTNIPRFNLYADIKKKLMAKGVPENEIAIINDKKYDKDETKERLFEMVNDGAVRIVLGSTEKLGTGVNAQERMVAIHNIDAPTRPMDLEQRIGRVIRPGNINKVAEVVNYTTVNSLDSVSFTRLREKMRFVNQILRGMIPGSNFEDPTSELQATFEDLVAFATNNPLVMKRFDLENQIREMNALYDGWARKKGQLRESIVKTQKNNEALETEIPIAEKMANFLTENFPPGVERVITSYDSEALPETALQDTFAALHTEMAAEYDKIVVDTRAERKDGGSVKTGKGAVTEWWVPYASQKMRDLKRIKKFKINDVNLELTFEIENKYSKFEDWDEHVFTVSAKLDPGTYDYVDWTGTVKSSEGSRAATLPYKTIKGMLAELQAKIDKEIKEPARLRESVAANNKNLASMEAELEKPFQFDDKLKAMRAELVDVLNQMETPATAENTSEQEVIDEQITKDIKADALAPAQPGGVVLSMNFDPTQTLAALRGLKNNIQEAVPHIEAIGRHLYAQGKKNYDSWFLGMKKFLGDLWRTFKPLVRGAWNKLKEERGSISFEKKDGESKPSIQDRLKKLDKSEYPEATKKIQGSYAREQQDPPASKDPAVLNRYLKDETDAIVQTILNKLRPKNMTWMEEMLKSPEWFDHPQVGKIVRLFMRDRNEIYHETFNHLNAVADPKVDGETVASAAKALKDKGMSRAERIAGKASKEYQQLAHYLEYFDTKYQRNKRLTVEESLKACEALMRREGASDDVVRVWRLYRDSYDKALDIQTREMRKMIAEIIAEAAEKGVSPDLEQMKDTLKGALAQMEQWRGFYAPRLREQGDWKVQAYKQGPSGAKEDRDWYRDHRGSELSAQRLGKKLEREGWTVYSIDRVEKLPEDIYQETNAVATAKLIDTALERISSKDAVGLALTAQFNEEVLRAVADEIRARGFRSHMMHRKEGDAVKGYIEDPISRHILYANQIASGTAKARVARMASKELLGERVKGKLVGGIDPVKESKEYQVAQNYLKEQLRNLDASDRVIGIAKSIATMKFLGFNLRSMAVNLTAIVTTAPASIHQYAMNGKGSMFRVLDALGRAGKDYGKMMAGGKLENADEQAFLDDAHSKGWDDAQYTRDALDTMEQTHSRLWGTLMDASMYLFGKSEQWNRGATMLAAYRLARKQGQDHATAAEAAKVSADRAHGVYGRSTLPMWAQGQNPAAKIGQMLYIYSKFAHNYLQMLHDVGVKRHNIKAAMYAFLAPIVVAGGVAVPFKDAIFAFAGFILRSLFGEDRDPEKWVWDTIREHLGDGAEKVGRHGLTGAAGVDISGSLSIGVGIPKNMLELTGAIGGVADAFATGGKALARGQYSKAVENILPTGLANPIRAAREAQEGVSTRANNRVWDEQGRPLKPSAGETAVRAMGFRSTRQAVLSERTWEGKRQATHYAELRQSIYQRYRAWLLGDQDPKEHKEIAKRVREYNDKVKKLKEGEVPRITFASMRGQVTRMQKAPKAVRANLTQ